MLERPAPLLEPFLGVRHARGQILGQQFQRASSHAQAVAHKGRQPARVLQGVVEQQAHPFRAQGQAQVRQQRLQARPSQIAGQGSLGRDGKHCRRAHQPRQVPPRKLGRFFQLGVVEQIGLADHEDQAIATRTQDAFFNEAAFGSREDLGGVEQKQRRIGPWHVAIGDVCALFIDVVHPWGVDQGDLLAQQGRRMLDLDVRKGFVRSLGARHGQPLRQLVQVDGLALAVFEHSLGRGLLAVPYKRQDRRGGRDTHRQEGLARGLRWTGVHRPGVVQGQQSIDEGRLAVVELAQHDEREAPLVELGDAHLTNVVGRGFQPGSGRQVCQAT